MRPRADAVGIARRATGAGYEDIVVDSLASGCLRALGTRADDAAAIKDTDALCGRGWGYHYYAPAVGDGAFDPGLNEVHPTRFEYRP